jgi:ATP-dependent DNA helicase DinG
MAAAVARVFEQGGVLLAEAATGTGKTLAYLVPAVLSGQRVLVSTGTKNLQEQIFFKDIPTLRTALNVAFRATYMKGRGNYLCLHRLERLSEHGGAMAHEVFLPIIRAWAAETDTGDRAELEDLPEDLAFWNEVAATADTCLGVECPYYDPCFVTRMRQRAAESDIVIVNHHLLCADAAVRQSAYGEVIPACHQLVIDEAHQLEDVVTQYFGVAVSTYRIEDLAKDIDRLAGSDAVDSAQTGEALARAVGTLRDSARTFFGALAAAHRQPRDARTDDRVRATDASLETVRESANRLAGALGGFDSMLSQITGHTSGDGTDSPSLPESAALIRRAREILDDLRFLTRADDPSYVYFVEFRAKGLFLRACPIDVSGVVRDRLLSPMRAVILTSATLSVDGTFLYIRDRLGIGKATEIRLPTEFDFRRQAVLYLPPHMPDPRSEAFPMAAAREVVAILTRTRGRAFVLFTSYATLRAVLPAVEMALDYPILVQGTAPRSLLLKRFRETPQSVLFATSSFWQGVDVAGEALSCVIVDKLPFASPAEPVTAARIDALREAGREPFDEYQVPLAILTLQQGLGRLIRHRQDRGVLAVLDPRLNTRRYGRRFLSALPDAAVVQKLADIEAFLSIV